MNCPKCKGLVVRVYTAQDDEIFKCLDCKITFQIFGEEECDDECFEKLEILVNSQQELLNNKATTYDLENLINRIEKLENTEKAHYRGLVDLRVDVDDLIEYEKEIAELKKDIDHLMAVYNTQQRQYIELKEQIEKLEGTVNKIENLYMNVEDWKKYKLPLLPSEILKEKEIIELKEQTEKNFNYINGISVWQVRKNDEIAELKELFERQEEITDKSIIELKEKFRVRENQQIMDYGILKELKEQIDDLEERVEEWINQ